MTTVSGRLPLLAVYAWNPDENVKQHRTTTALICARSCTRPSGRAGASSALTWSWRKLRRSGRAGSSDSVMGGRAEVECRERKGDDRVNILPDSVRLFLWLLFCSGPAKEPHIQQPFLFRLFAFPIFFSFLPNSKPRAPRTKCCAGVAF